MTDQEDVASHGVTLRLERSHIEHELSCLTKHKLREKLHRKECEIKARL